MPPKRRTSGHGSAASAQRAQPKLSFGRQASNRITKPGATKQTSKVKADPDLVEPVANVEPNPSSEPTTAEAAILEQAASVTAEVDPLEQENQKTEDVLGGRAPFSDTGARGGKSDSGWNGDEEGQARKMTDAQIKKYWQAKERERKAPRVHQGDLTLQEKILREWDMSGQYGVSQMGGTWRRQEA